MAQDRQPFGTNLCMHGSPFALLLAALTVSSASAAAAAPMCHLAQKVAEHADLARFACSVPQGYRHEHYNDLILYNCERVQRAVGEFRKAVQSHVPSECQRQVWEQKGHHAQALCAQARSVNGTEVAARLAINAWGNIMQEGRECCTWLHAPHCANTTWSSSTFAFAAPFCILFLLLVGSMMTAWCLPRSRKEEAVVAELDHAPTLDRLLTMPMHVVRSNSTGSSESPFRAELEDGWLRGSCLRVMPGAPSFARASASLFNALCANFDFQADSVRNQYHHLLSLWRSQCAMVADRSVELLVQVDEEGLLAEALGDLHAEMLDGFLCWREKFAAYAPAGVPKREEGDVPMLGGISWNVLKGDDDSLESGERLAAVRTTEEEAKAMSQQLAEIAAYLLVWGEAGNLRFMPEVIYFITELALAADPLRREDLYAGASFDADKGQYHSGLFLSKITRPIYNVVFDEWYERVDVDPNTKKDKKKLHPELDNFLPPDVANYDDWNEFFCDPKRVVDGLLLSDGTRLCELPHGRRFAALSRVDWQGSLDAAETKTHREVHSLWGVFASTHRIWLVHAILFFLGIIMVNGNPTVSEIGGPLLLGQTKYVRYAALGLLVPIQALLRGIARWHVTGQAKRRAQCGCWCLLRVIFKGIWWTLPAVSYAAVRVAFSTDILADVLEAYWPEILAPVAPRWVVLGVHFTLSGLGLFILVFVPDTKYNLWAPTKVPFHSRVMRYCFWFTILAVKFLLGLIIFNAINNAVMGLNLVRPGSEPIDQIASFYYSTTWLSHILLWFLMWTTTFLLFVSDTQLWFTFACAFLGVATAFVQRGCKFFHFSFEDAVSLIPQRFSEKVLTYSQSAASLQPTNSKVVTFSPHFPLIWDRIIEYMRYEDKIENQQMGDLSFQAGYSGHQVYWHQLNKPLQRGRREENTLSLPPSRVGTGLATPGPPSPQPVSPQPTSQAGHRRVKIPDIFRKKSPCEQFFKQYCGVPDPHWPSNQDVQWRLSALARGLGLPMPRPFRAPYMPGITVLIPHYSEQIVMLKKDLFQADREEVPLMSWLKHKYEAEFSAFTSRMQGVRGDGDHAAWPVVGSQWDEYADGQWDKIGSWAAMRMQTLWRTVAGMCLYHPALQIHYDAQADRTSKLAKEGVWDPSDCFNCIVSMQMYAFFDQVQITHTNQMLEKFPDCLKVAYIDCENKGIAADADAVHKMQRRRYYSCLIDKTCEMNSDGTRAPMYRIELPGFPILGDGKGDNQNHAIPFMRGTFAQCIDANQGAYFEQMLLLPCALGEFRSRRRGDSGSKRIIGFPEHITSDMGSIGDFAASAEVAFGTVLQRTYSVLGARMHYGHPDIMNKLYMMQQGGVSKATKTLNLSEDIFAGMDFTLRGQDRQIRHCEYFHVAKGRDLGFNTVLGFFSKLSSGTGEQVLTRQAFRLGQVLQLPEALSFYYAHVGYYFTQFLVSLSLPVLVFVWLLVLINDCEEFRSFQHCDDSMVPAAEVIAKALGMWFSWLLLLFLVAQSLPLFAEMWMESSLKSACVRTVKQYVTLAPLLFIFQAKIIGHYVMNELRYGGATYVSTGRGLPTDRRPFIGEVDGSGTLKKVGGLYLDYAAIAYYDGAKLLCGVIFVILAGGVTEAGKRAGELNVLWFSVALMVTSWLFAPFIFNPYQFLAKHFVQDLRCTIAFFTEDCGRHWAEWYERTQLKARQEFHRSPLDITFFTNAFFVVVWYAAMNLKIEAFTSVYAKYASGSVTHALMLVPPLAGSLAYCILATTVESFLKCTNVMRRRQKHRRHTAARKAARKAAETQNSKLAPEPQLMPAGGEAPEVEVGSEGSEAVTPDAPHQRQQDRVVQPTASQIRRTRTDLTDAMQEEATGCCRYGIPLAISAILVICLDSYEIFLTLRELMAFDWQDALLAGLILKYYLLTIFLYLGEALLRSRCHAHCSALTMPIEMWVQAHRMARDILTSGLIICGLAPFVLLNSLNDNLCPGCSAHQLLIYRDPGHLARKEAVVVDILADEILLEESP